MINVWFLAGALLCGVMTCLLIVSACMAIAAVRAVRADTQERQKEQPPGDDESKVIRFDV